LRGAYDLPRVARVRSLWNRWAMDGLREFPSPSRAYFVGIFSACTSIFCQVIAAT
jgi:hypothetical protein